MEIIFYIIQIHTMTLMHRPLLSDIYSKPKKVTQKAVDRHWTKKKKK